MGGFINGKMSRVPGAKVKCLMCKRELDEQRFSFSPHNGYYCYCRECHGERMKVYREKRKKGIFVPKYGATKEDKEMEIQKNALAYKTELMDTVVNTHIGDIFWIDDRKNRVELITGSYVLMVNNIGIREAFLWDDLVRILNNTFKRSE